MFIQVINDINNAFVGHFYLFIYVFPSVLTTAFRQVFEISFEVKIFFRRSQ